MTANTTESPAGADERRDDRADGGFTLIELLLVIAILGVLSAVAVFSVRGVSDRGQGASCKATRASLATAAEAYFATNGAIAADLATLETTGFLASPADGGHYTSNSVSSVSGNVWTITYSPAASANPPTYSLTGTCPS